MRWAIKIDYGLIWAYILNMPTSIYPLCFNTNLFDSEIRGRETSDGIYLAQGRFRAFMGQDDESVVVLELSCGDRTGYAHINGVHSDDDAILYAPNWMCQLLRCHGGEEIELRQCNPSMGTKITIQPHTSEYTRLDDPVSALRDAFEHYTCLVSGIDIPLVVAGSTLIVSIVDTGRVGPVCIRGIDLEVEIQTPLDAPVVEDATGGVGAAPAVDFDQMLPASAIDFSQMIPTPAPVDNRFPGVGRRLG
jgi:hypothetical protein